MKLSNGKSVVKGMVTHFMAFSNPQLYCWVVLHSHGGVACGHCDCIGGTIQSWHNKSATKHPVSVAFTFYTMKHEIHDLNSITSLPGVIPTHMQTNLFLGYRDCDNKNTLKT
ncbi:hypothetical protein GHT06_016974 [Daphnia sinensis]|uniref:Uncharacterized protein n=1 Tax=Daphnia sinensis TaxID=1820382 RepID=A0AAD5KR03_9CRUS|nr:hypothetical protein GHT06_016974 [Daphnia sinensis]